MKNMIAVLAALIAAAAGAEMEPATPESQGVSSQAILDWLDACEGYFDGGEQGALHGFVIVRHGKVIAEGSWKPFDTLNETHMLYSHSKSFTSSAIGFLADEGKIDLDERIVDIFSNEVPATVSENLAQLRVRDLLTMNVGKRDHLARGEGDWVREVLGRDFFLRPGSGFKYDSDVTYMLAAIVERKSGEKMMDYLKRKMFDRIGITKAWTTYSPQGVPCGGWGMNMTTRELARFGQLYLQRGKWNGEAVLSPFWVDLATARHTWSGWQNVGVKSLGEGSDWEQGYGFQFWRCCPDGVYRADGAAGQFTVVMPEQDMVVSVNAGLDNMGRELAYIWKHLLPAAKDAPLPENPEAQAKLRARIAALAIKPVPTLVGVNLAGGKFFACEFKENHRGFKSVRFDLDGGKVNCTLETRAGKQVFPAGLGAWETGKIRIDTENYEALGGYIGEHKIVASCGYAADGTFRLKAYFTGDTGNLEFAVKDGTLTGRFYAMNGCRLESK